MHPDKDECDDPSGSLCENNGTCINTQGSYKCNCVDGWQEQNCNVGKLFLTVQNDPILYIDRIFKQKEMYDFFFFQDIDECTMNNPCKNNATCINTDGSYHCECEEGWRGQNCHTGEML